MKFLHKSVINKMSLFALLPVFLLVVSGCGLLKKGSSTNSGTINVTTSCSYVSSADLNFCGESENADPESVKQSCSSNKGTFSDTGCPISTGVFGCRATNTNGVNYTNWMTGSAWTNDSNSKTGMQAACKSINGTIVQK